MTSTPDLRTLTRRALMVLVQTRTYLNLLYLALGLPLAVLYVAVLLVCAVSGALLTVALGFGILILLAGLVAAWGFSLLERELATSLLGIELQPPAQLPPGSPWERLRAHLNRAETWKSLAYLGLKLPFGLFTYALGALILVPAIGLIFELPRDLLFGGGPVNGAAHIFSTLVGIALLITSLNVANWLAALWSRVAFAILGPSEQQRQLWAAQQRAEAADRKRRELIVNVSHELRTPIASIQGHLDSLLMPEDERPPDVEPERYLQVAAAETRRLAMLVNELLELARADASSLALAIRPIDVVPIAENVTNTLAPLARQERQVTVVHANGAGPHLALADPDRLTQVLTNLVRNAINHTPAGGAVRLSVSGEYVENEKNSHVLLAVADTGSGIDAADLERIFDRFYRTDEARSRDAGGFGLGLSIAKDLVEAMGGTITASSEVGVGSTFTVRLRRPPGRA